MHAHTPHKVASYKKRRIEIEFIHEVTMQRRYLPLHKVAQLADPSAKQTGIAYRHLFSFLRGLLLSFISLLFCNCFLFLCYLVFLSPCRVLGCVLCFVFSGGLFFFAAHDCHSNHDFASWHSGARLCLNRYFRHLRVCARLRCVGKCVFLDLASPLRVLFL